MVHTVVSCATATVVPASALSASGWLPTVPPLVPFSSIAIGEWAAQERTEVTPQVSSSAVTHGHMGGHQRNLKITKDNPYQRHIGQPELDVLFTSIIGLLMDILVISLIEPGT